jgi:cation transport ATPase
MVQMRGLADIVRQVVKLIALAEQRASHRIAAAVVDAPTRPGDQHHQQRIDQ